jgi:O-antigen ligase
LYGALTLYYIAAFLFLAIAFLGRVINREILSDLKMGELLVLIFMLNIAIVIGARGVGLRMLGDENWGGMRYITLLIACGLVIVVRFVPLTAKQWNRTFLWFLALSCLPFVGQLLFVLSSGAVYFHYYFIAFEGVTADTYSNFMTGENILRFSGASSAAEAVVFFTVCYVRFTNFRKFIVIILLLMAFGLAGLSGHRIVLIRLAAFLWFYGLFHNRKRFFQYFMISGALGIVGIGFLYFVAPYLPHNAQRMISFLPGVPISLTAKMSADVTTTWRIGVWHEAIKLIPEYFWLGRGYTFLQGFEEKLMLGARGDFVYFWALETASYHNGILSLLIGLGISGLVVGTWMLCAIPYRNFKRQKNNWNNQTLKQIHNVVFISTFVNVLIYFTIYGDVHVSFPKLFFQFMMMEGLWYSDSLIQKKKDKKIGSMEAGRLPAKP